MKNLKKFKRNFSKETLNSKNTNTKKLQNLSNFAYSFITKSIFFSEKNLIHIDQTQSEYPSSFASFKRYLKEESNDISYSQELSFSLYDKIEIDSNKVFFSSTNCSKCDNEI
jgi:hypothetical protein